MTEETAAAADRQLFDFFEFPFSPGRDTIPVLILGLLIFRVS
jgi:hypothetical protein